MAVTLIHCLTAEKSLLIVSMFSLIYIFVQTCGIAAFLLGQYSLLSIIKQPLIDAVGC